jgi:hypothetical protein
MNNNNNVSATKYFTDPTICPNTRSENPNCTAMVKWRRYPDGRSYGLPHEIDQKDENGFPVIHDCRPKANVKKIPDPPLDPKNLVINRDADGGLLRKTIGDMSLREYVENSTCYCGATITFRRNRNFILEDIAKGPALDVDTFKEHNCLAGCEDRYMNILHAKIMDIQNKLETKDFERRIKNLELRLGR